jgi:competence protein ComEA
MRSTRGTSGAEPSRTDAASRRLALLAADLGAADDDFTRVVPARRAVPPALPPPEPDPVVVEPPPGPPALPRPGRHAARRRLQWAAVRLPGLGAAQLTVLALVVAAGIALTAWWVVRDQSEPTMPAAAEPAATAEPLVAATPGVGASPTTSGEVTVDVTGKVRRPGIVVLDTGARVVDAVAAAGGERTGVDLSSLNLARVLVDGEQIVVGGPQVTVPAMPSGSSPSGAPVTLVNLNTATQAELETLPDVGPVTAMAILSWRDQHGGFTSVDELLEVDGIGEATLSNLTPYVTV